ncbi:uncharacterized protein LOC142340051 [Convolutriloba macropyga]|uniref:uncharacterized protein LOC142340051 n=1 Tax=Convolutriloba macropyga TaxID=536237 RepID=UPI003F521F85
MTSGESAATVKITSTGPYTSGDDISTIEYHYTEIRRGHHRADSLDAASPPNMRQTLQDDLSVSPTHEALFRSAIPSYHSFAQNTQNSQQKSRELSSVSLMSHTKESKDISGPNDAILEDLKKKNEPRGLGREPSVMHEEIYL